MIARALPELYQSFVRAGSGVVLYVKRMRVNHFDDRRSFVLCQSFAGGHFVCKTNEKTRFSTVAGASPELR